MKVSTFPRADEPELFPVDTRRRFNVYRRRIDVETTSCVYWVSTIRTVRARAVQAEEKHLSEPGNWFISENTGLTSR